MSMFFKRSMSALLAATMLTMAAPFDSLAVLAEDLESTVTIGSADVNGDKQVDEKDCALILEAIGSTTGTASVTADNEALNVYGDAVIDVRDLMAVKDAINGIKAYVPEEATVSEQVDLSISSTTGYAGEKATFAISLADWEMDVAAFEMRLSLDNALTVEEVSCNGDVQYKLDGSTLKLYGMYSGSPAYRGTLATITVTLPPEAYGDYGVSVVGADFFNSAYQEYAYQAATGGVTVDMETKPVYLRASELNSKSLQLSWSMPFDADKVTGYIISRDGEEIGRTEDLFFDDKDLETGKSYLYSVQAYGTDYLSAPSRTITVIPTAPVIQSISLPDGKNAVGGASTLVTCLMEHGVRAKTYTLYCTDEEGTRTVISEGEDQSFSELQVRWQLSELKTGTYTLGLTLTDVDGSEVSAETTAQVDNTPPGEVFGFTVIPGDEQNELTWGIAAELKVVGYRIYRRTATSNYSELAYVEGRSTLKYVDKDVETGLEYFYIIAAVDKYGMEGTFSAEVSGSAHVDQTMPEITLFLPGSGTVLYSVVTLNVKAQDNIGVAKITCFLSDDEGETWKALFTANGDSVSYRFDTSAYDEASVQIKAVAYDYAGNESSGANINIYAIDNKGPEQVTGVNLKTSGATTATVAWEDVPDQDLHHFVVRYGVTGSSGYKTENIYRTLGINLSGLKPGESYTVVVAAVDIYGNQGEFSEPLIFTTPEDTTAPVIASIYPTPSYFAKAIPLQVNARDDFSVASVTVEASTDQKTWKQIAVIENTEPTKNYFSAPYTLDVTDYPEGTLYVRAYAEDLAGNKGTVENAAVYEYMVDRTAPVAMDTLRAVENDSCIELLWEEADTDVDYYRLYRADGEDGEFRLLYDRIRYLNHFDRQVTTDVQYRYRVTAVDIAGNESEPSNVVAATLQEDTTAPEIQSISPETGSELSLNDHSIGILASDNLLLSSLTVEYKTDPDAETYQALKNFTDLTDYYLFATVEIPNLLMVDGTTIYIRAQATDRSGNVSEYAYSAYKVNNAVTAVTKVTVEQTETANTVKWTANESEQTSGYRIFRKIGSGSYDLIATRAVETNGDGSYAFADEDLRTAGTYTYKIVSVNYNGNTSSRVSGSVSVHTKPVPTLNCDTAMEQGVAYVFDASGSKDQGLLNALVIEYGDGAVEKATSPETAKFEHTYQETGVYQVKLTCTNEFGLVSVLTRSVQVVERQLLGTVTVQVKTTDGKAASNIGVYMDFGTDAQTKYVADSRGIVTFQAPAGAHDIGVYGDGYLPQVKNCIVTAGEENAFSFAVVEQYIVSAEFEIKRMTLDEIVAAGIDITQPENQQIVQINVDLTYEITTDSGKKTQSMALYVNNRTKTIISSHTTKGDNSVHYEPVFVRYDEKTGEVSTVAMLSVPVNVSYLKEFFDVQLHIINNADEQFNISDSTVSLNVPKGLTLMESAASCDSRIVNIPSIPGKSQKTLSWILRGDHKGEYYLSADFSGTLDQFNEKIETTFVSEEAIKVYGETAVGITINVPRASRNNKTYFDVQMKNNTDSSVYNVGASVGTIVAQIMEHEKYTLEGKPLQARIISPKGEMELIDLTESIEELRPGYTLSVVYSIRNIVPGTLFARSTVRLVDATIRSLSDSNFPVSLRWVDSIKLLEDGDYDGITSNVRVDKDVDLSKEYVIAVVNAAGNWVPGATIEVTYPDKTTKTFSADSLGRVRFDRPAGGSETVGIRVSADTYKTHEDSDYYLKYRGTDTVMLNGESSSDYALTKAMYKKAGSWNLLTGYKRLNMGNKVLDFAIECAVAAKDAESCQLLQNGKIIQEVKPSGGKFSFTGLNVKDFEEMGDGETLTVRVYQPNGAYYDSKINLTILPDPTVVEPSFEFSGDAFTFGISDSIPFFGGSSVKIPYPPILEHLNICMDENKIRIGINVDLPIVSTDKEDKAALDKFVEDFEKLKTNLKRSPSDLLHDQSINTGKISLGKAEVKVLGGGYVEGDFSENGKAILNGYLYIGIEAGANFDYQTVVWVIPVTAELGLTGKIVAGSTITFTYDFDHAWQMDAKVTAQGTLGVEVFGGVGFSSIAAIGVYGGAELDLDMQLYDTSNDSGPRINTLDLTGELGFRAYVGPFEYKKAWASQTWHLYTNPELANSEQDAAPSYLAPLYDTAAYSLSEETQAVSKWLGGSEMEPDKVQTLLTNANNGADPQLATDGTNYVLVYLEKDPERSVYDASRLMYAVYTAETGTWSDPKPVDENETGDYQPALFGNGDGIYLAYQEANQTFGADSELTVDAYAASLGVTCAVFDAEQQSFGAVTTMTVPENSCNSIPTVFEDGGLVYAAWVSNAKGNYFGTEGANTIFYSICTEGTWSEPAALASDLTAVTGLQIGKLESGVSVACITDGDRDLTTADDRTMTLIAADGTQQQVVTGCVSAPVFAQPVWSDSPLLLWYDTYNLSCTADGKEIAQLFAQGISGLTDAYTLLPDGVVYTSAGKDGSDLFLIRYDAAQQAWGAPIQLTDTEGYINGAGAAVCGDQLLLTMLRQNVTITEDDVQVESALCALLRSTFSDLSVDKVDYDFTQLQPGSQLPLDVTVTNHGDSTVNSVTIGVYTKDGTPVNTQDVETTLLSGTAQVLAASFQVPEDMSTTEYQVIVSVPDTTDVNEADNAAAFSIGYTELSLTTDQLITAQGTKLQICVTNESLIPTGGILDLYHYGESQEPVLSLIVEELQPGQSTVYTVDVDDSIISEDNRYVMVKLTADEAEYDESDNEELVAVYLGGSLPTVTIGDVNGDGEITVNDAVMLLDECAARAVGTTTLDKAQRSRGDVNEDGSITLTDAILILNYCAEKLVDPELTFADFLKNAGGNNE